MQFFPISSSSLSLPASSPASPFSEPNPTLDSVCSWPESGENKKTPTVAYFTEYPRP